MEDLRHVMKTILSVPECHKGQIYCQIYETDLDLHMRNSLIMLLALYYPDGQAAELITHLWYSASIPQAMYLLVVDIILPLLRSFLEKADSSSPDARYLELKPGSSALGMVMNKKELEELCSRLDPEGFEPVSEAERKRWNQAHTVEPDISRRRAAYLESLPPWQRMTENRYRYTGILLPYGTPIQPLRYPNP